MVKNNTGKILATLILLILLTSTTVYALNINLDGDESDWRSLDYVYPGGRGCDVVNMPSYSAWLCCNQYPNPTECQLMWKDKQGDAPANVDIVYTRLYTNSSGLYLFISVKNLVTKFTNVTIRLCGKKLDINLENPPQGVSYVISKDNLEMSISYTVSNIKLCDFGMKIVRKPPGLAEGDNLKVKVYAETITSVTLIFNDCHIIDGLYDSIPIPIPEPWYIGVVVMITTLIMLLFISKRFRA